MLAKIKAENAHFSKNWKWRAHERHIDGKSVCYGALTGLKRKKRGPWPQHIPLPTSKASTPRVLSQKISKKSSSYFSQFWFNIVLFKLKTALESSVLTFKTPKCELHRHFFDSADNYSKTTYILYSDSLHPRCESLIWLGPQSTFFFKLKSWKNSHLSSCKLVTYLIKKWSWILFCYILSKQVMIFSTMSMDIMNSNCHHTCSAQQQD